MELPVLDGIKRELIEIEYEDNHETIQGDQQYEVKSEGDSQIFEELDWCIEKEAVSLDYKDICSTYCYVGGGDELKFRFNKKCSRCFKVFSDDFLLLKHNITHIRIKLTSCLLTYKYKCHMCLVYYKTKKELQKHKSKHSKENKKVKCTKCSDIFTYKKLHAHMAVAHPDDDFYCGDCNIKFKCAQYLRRHMLYQHGNESPSWRFHSISDTEIKCSHCPNVFKNKSALTTHMRNCHSKAHDCEICGSTLKSWSYLLTHMRRVHYSDGRKYKCDICGKKYRSHRYLKIHKKNSQHFEY